MRRSELGLRKKRAQKRAAGQAEPDCVAVCTHAGCVVNYDDTVIVCPQSRVYLAPSITWAAHARPGTYHRVTLFDNDT